MRKLKKYALGYSAMTLAGSAGYWVRLSMYGKDPTLASVAPSSYFEALGQCAIVALIVTVIAYYLLEHTK